MNASLRGTRNSGKRDTETDARSKEASSGIQTRRTARKEMRYNNGRVESAYASGCKEPVSVEDTRSSKARFKNRKRPKSWLTPTVIRLLTYLSAARVIPKLQSTAQVSTGAEVSLLTYTCGQGPPRLWLLEAACTLGALRRSSVPGAAKQLADTVNGLHKCD